MRFFGDLHGKVFEYFGQAAEVAESIQVGDFGFGFMSPKLTEASIRFQDSGNHIFIRGNHEAPEVFRKAPGWVEDGSYIPHLEMMLIGGARSIDHGTRVEGFDWWPDEELSQDELDTIYRTYCMVRPRIMVTHDVADGAAHAMFDMAIPNRRFEYTSITRIALQRMWDFHQPDLWVFGHWHHTQKKKIGNTEFVCVGKNEYIDIDLEPYLKETAHARYQPEVHLPLGPESQPGGGLPLR